MKYTLPEPVGLVLGAYGPTPIAIIPTNPHYTAQQMREAYAAGQRDMREAAAKVCENESCSCCWDESATEMASHLQDAINALPIGEPTP